MDTPHELDIARLLSETFLASAELHESLPSTNDRARELAELPGTALPRLIAAEEQTAGRGRGANRWWTGPGSLAFSLLIDSTAIGIRREHSGLVSLAAAAAIVKTISTIAREQAIGLHWPNDVFAEGRKVAGILVESLPAGRLVIGVGVNVNNRMFVAPAEVRELAVSLADLTDQSHDRPQLLIDLLNQLDKEFTTLATDPPAIGRQAHDLCLQLGQCLTIDTGQEVVAGQCLGIQPDGALRLQTSRGPRAFYAGVLRRST